MSFLIWMTRTGKILENFSFSTARIWILLKKGNLRGKEKYYMALKMQPIHPGEILNEEFLQGFDITQYRLAKDISVPPRRINEIVHGERAITADTALRLCRFFGMSPQFWLNLQTRYDLEVAEDLLEDRLDEEVHALQVQAG